MEEWERKREKKPADHSWPENTVAQKTYSGQETLVNHQWMWMQANEWMKSNERQKTWFMIERVRARSTRSDVWTITTTHKLSDSLSKRNGQQLRMVNKIVKQSGCRQDKKK